MCAIASVARHGREKKEGEKGKHRFQKGSVLTATAFGNLFSGARNERRGGAVRLSSEILLTLGQLYPRQHMSRVGKGTSNYSNDFNLRGDTRITASMADREKGKLVPSALSLFPQRSNLSPSPI